MDDFCQLVLENHATRTFYQQIVFSEEWSLHHLWLNRYDCLAWQLNLQARKIDDYELLIKIYIYTTQIQIFHI